jgi:pimeloyl-ACP methyl ester carboxylesterase
MDARPLEPIPDITPIGFADPPAGQGLSRYSGQKLTWRTCAGTFQCAEVLAPLDYAAPDGTALTLALAKRAATKTPRLGTLFINPGGPGGSGRQYVTYFDRAGLENYDIVGWDPRGVGASTPVGCYGTKDLDRYFSVDVSPDTAAEETTYLQESRAFGQSCLSHSGRLLQHISTTETVRDLDLLRGLVGDDKINYFGSSYGTQIGSLYAQLFPKRVGRMVLDGAVDVTGKSPVSQIEGFERALHHFATWCAAKHCQLGDSRAHVLTAVRRYLDGLDQSPAKVPNGRLLSQQQGVQAVLTAMYGGTAAWPGLRTALENAVRKNDAQKLLQLADEGNRRFSNGQYDQLAYSFPAIRCLDSQDVSVKAAEKEEVTDERKAPILGRLAGADVTCPLWPVAPAPKPPEISAPGAAPIVVIGTTGDPATPYEYAVTMAAKLSSGVLVTWNGEGHLAYGSSACVRRLVKAYLEQDRVPPNGSRC